MKILSISHMYPSQDNHSEGIVIENQVKELQKLGHEIIVISPTPFCPFPLNLLSQKWNYYNRIPRKDNVKGIDVFYPRYLSFPKNFMKVNSGLRMFLSTKNLVLKLYKNFNFDIIHAHMGLPDGEAAICLKKLLNKPVVITIRGTDVDQNINISPSIHRKIKHVLNNADAVIAPSPLLQKKLLEKLEIESDIVPNGFCINDLFVQATSLREKYRGKKILLSVSSLIEQKGIQYNIQAVNELRDIFPDLLYLVVGDGRYRKELEHLVSKLNLLDYVEFLGNQPYNKTMEYMSICDLFSMPSWNETFGLVYIEAMAHGKPVIGTIGHGIDGIIKDKHNGLLVEPKNITQLVNVIEWVFSNEDKVQKIASNGKKFVTNHLSWEKHGKKIEEIYQKVLKDK